MGALDKIAGQLAANAGKIVISSVAAATVATVSYCVGKAKGEKDGFKKASKVYDKKMKEMKKQIDDIFQ